MDRVVSAALWTPKVLGIEQAFKHCWLNDYSSWWWKEKCREAPNLCRVCISLTLPMLLSAWNVLPLFIIHLIPSPSILRRVEFHPLWGSSPPRHLPPTILTPWILPYIFFLGSCVYTSRSCSPIWVSQTRNPVLCFVKCTLTFLISSLFTKYPKLQKISSGLFSSEGYEDHTTKQLWRCFISHSSLHRSKTF